MSRVRIPLSIESHKTVSGTVCIVPVSGATIAGTNRVTAASCKFYTTETSETPVASPVTDENGNIPYWVEEGAWNITVEGGSPSIAPVTYGWDGLSGRGTVKIAAGAVTSSMLANEAVGTAQLAKEGITTAKFASGAVTGSAIAASTIKTSNFENSAVTFAKMAGPYGTVLANSTPLITASGNTTVLAPISFTAHGGHCFAIWSTSGYNNLGSAGVFAFYLDLDNVYTNSQSFMYLNNSFVHHAFPTTITPLGVLTGSHTLRIRSSSFLSTDNDLGYLAVFELP